MAARPHKKAHYGKERNMNVLLVGLNYRATSETQTDLARRTPFEVVLQREPKNDFDPNAVMVTMAEIRPGMLIGYVSKAMAVRLAPMMDNEEIRILATAVTEIDPETGTGQMLVSFVKKISS